MLVVRERGLVHPGGITEGLNIGGALWLGVPYVTMGCII